MFVREKVVRKPKSIRFIMLGSLKSGKRVASPSFPLEFQYPLLWSTFHAQTYTAQRHLCLNTFNGVKRKQGGSRVGCLVMPLGYVSSSNLFSEVLQMAACDLIVISKNSTYTQPGQQSVSWIVLFLLRKSQIKSRRLWTIKGTGSFREKCPSSLYRASKTVTSSSRLYKHILLFYMYI